MLFSATQNKKIDDLVNLSLSSKPVYIGVHDESSIATVQGLEQVCIYSIKFMNMQSINYFIFRDILFVLVILDFYYYLHS